MKTRTNEQIRTHAQKYFQKLRELRSVRLCRSSFCRERRGPGRLSSDVSLVCVRPVTGSRYRGYQGPYTMDGTRHLTKTFLKGKPGRSKSQRFSWPLEVGKK